MNVYTPAARLSVFKIPVTALNAPEAEVSVQVPPASAPDRSVFRSTDEPGGLHIAVALSAPANTSCSTVTVKLD